MHWCDWLVARFKAAGPVEAKQHAHVLTCWLSDNYGNLVDDFRLSQSGDLIAYLEPLAGSTIGTSLLDVPWTSFEAAFLDISPRTKVPPEIRWLLTLPGVTSKTQHHHIDIGVYIDAVAELFLRSTSSIVMANPYWSLSAVIRLTNRLQEWLPPSGFVFRVITKPIQTKADQDTVDHLERFFTQKKVMYSIRFPEPLHGIVHAKFVIADAKEILLGSTNLTHQGVAENFELGILLRDESLVKPLYEIVKQTFLMQK